MNRDILNEKDYQQIIQTVHDVDTEIVPITDTLQVELRTKRNYR
jgi:hypothetical protein